MRQLGTGGFEVIEAESAADALIVLNERSDVAVLFTDINMPGALDGLALRNSFIGAGRRSSS